MRTMHPVVGLGSYLWDQEWLPLDEFEERLRAVRRIMAERGWAGLIVHGNSQDSALLTYLTNFYPRLRWTLALVPLEGDLRLLVAGSPRDLPAARPLTWVKEVEDYGLNARKMLPAWIDALPKSGTHPRIGLYGADWMRRPIHATVAGAIAGRADAEPADEALEPLMRRKRPRELAMARRSAALLAETVTAMARAKDDGATTVAASIAAERTARLAAAQDIRVLFSLDRGRTLRPFEGLSEIRCDPLVAYVAVRYLGYWSEAMVTLGDSPARKAAAAALGAMIEAAKPGATGGELAAISRRHLGNLAPHPVIGGRVGHGIGLALDEAPILDANGGAMEPGGIYSLHVGVSDGTGCALVSAMVAVGEGCEVLWSAV